MQYCQLPSFVTIEELKKVNLELVGLGTEKKQSQMNVSGHSTGLEHNRLLNMNFLKKKSLNYL